MFVLKNDLRIIHNPTNKIIYNAEFFIKALIKSNNHILDKSVVNERVPMETTLKQYESSREVLKFITSIILDLAKAVRSFILRPEYHRIDKFDWEKIATGKTLPIPDSYYFSKRHLALFDFIYKITNINNMKRQWNLSILESVWIEELFKRYLKSINTTKIELGK